MWMRRPRRSRFAAYANELAVAEAALRRSEESYRHLFERHPAPMWVYDPETFRFLAANAATLEASGYSREELMAMTPDDFLHEEDRVMLRDHVEHAADTVQSGLWELQTKNGSLRYVETSATSIVFEGRDARLVLAKDITEQRRLEEELRQTQKMDAIGRLAGGVAHDFNNLLVVIRGYSAILLERLRGDELEQIRKIDTAAQRASEFTRQLLAFSRQQVLHPESIDMNEVVADAIAMLERSLGEDIAIEADLDPAVGAVLVDRSELTKAILNLVINARDAMPNGGRLHIRTANTDLERGALDGDAAPVSYVQLQITDSGIGMDEETKRRAFDPFFTTKQNGTGLGLATVYGLVKQSGGHVSVDSEPDVGTTVEVYLPVTGIAGPPAAPEVPVESVHGDEVILLVEDTDIVRDLVNATLTSYGYEVLSSPNAEQAIKLAESFERDIDLLLTDVVMPGMNGRELAEHLVASRPGLKVLFTSGYPADTVLREGIAYARAAFIEKPYVQEELARAIRRLLETVAGSPG